MGPFPYFPVEFTKDGDAFTPAQVQAVLAAVAPAAAKPITDLFVISHGWNDNMQEAEDLYAKIFDRVAAVMGQPNAVTANVKSRNAVVVGILWPSKKFDEESLTPGGAASLPTDPNASLVGALDTLAAFVDSDDARAALGHAKTLIPKLSSDLDARDEFGRILRAFMPHDANAEEPAIAEDLFTLSGDELLRRLSRPAHDAPAADSGGAAGFTDWIGKAATGAKSLASLVTYYQMKNRAGIVGQRGVYDMLRQIRAARPQNGAPPLRIHLMGHSFGCRLVTAATAGPDNAPSLSIDSLSLFQAAFSHFAFAQQYDGAHDGLFRRVLTETGRLTGPLIISFTSKDKAVGMAYPIASRLARQVASAMGDANDPYGGLGRNGAQKTPTAQTVLMNAAGTAYTFTPRGIYNLDANSIITAHSDLGHDEVAWALLSSVATTP
jgi:hypothetical protein